MAERHLEHLRIKRRKNRGACGECSEKNPWLDKRLEMEIKNRTMQN